MKNTSAALWIGSVPLESFALFLLIGSVAPKLLGMVVEETMAELGWPPGYPVVLGMIELACVIFYLTPRTSLLGATLTMTLLGGAQATQFRAESPLVSHILFSFYLGLLLCGGLWLGSPWLRGVFPLVRLSHAPALPSLNTK